MTEILLVGTYHGDLKGPQRLRKFLNWYEPEVITVESSQNSFDNMYVLREKIKKNAYPNSVLAQELAKNFVFENIESFEYALENGIGCYPVESPLIDSISPRERRAYSQDDVSIPWSRNSELSEYIERIDELYRTSFTPSDVSKEYLQLRDDHMLERMNSHFGKKLLHVSGNCHIFDNYENLFDKVVKHTQEEKNLGVSRMKLIEADNFYERGWTS